MTPAATSPAVLVVEDDPAMGSLVEDALAKHFRVTWRRSASEAIATLEQEAFDVVVSDVRMPGMSGTELCRQVAAMRPNVPVIVMTAFGSVETAVDALRAGAFDYVVKPIPMDALRILVEKAVELRRMRSELTRLKAEVSATRLDRGIVGQSRAITKVKELLGRVAASTATVLVTGESGTGKELAARALHDASDRAARPFVAINCAAMPEALLESELFGHVKGAFTDAKASHEGLFVQAGGGTLFLDEIGDMPLALQPKLLRVLQEQKVRPIGAGAEVSVDVRVVAATHRDMEQAIADKTFREDLYYRLAVVEIGLPPLRARAEDILPLALHLLARIAARTGAAPHTIGPSVAEHLVHHTWPGNVRELANAMERAVALAQGAEIALADLPDKIRARVPPPPSLDGAGLPEEILSLDEVERRYVARAFELLGRNRTLTAQTLGIDRKTLAKKLGKTTD